jgi:hypothetical protein
MVLIFQTSMMYLRGGSKKPLLTKEVGRCPEEHGGNAWATSFGISNSVGGPVNI